MSELNVLLPLRSLRVKSRELELEQLVLAAEHLNIVIAERQEEESKRLAEEAEKADKKLMILELMKEQGLSVTDLFDGEKPTKPRKSSAAKYQLNDKSWSGQGRQPKWITEFIENGGDIETLLIKK